MTTTVTDSEPHADNHFNLGGIDQSEIDAALQDNKAKDKAGRKAVAELTKPIAPQLMMGRILAAISGILAIAPYIALINLVPCSMRQATPVPIWIYPPSGSISPF